MQTQAQISGQQGQVPQLIKGGLPLPRRPMAPWPKQWHSADDLNLRREIFSCIAQFVQKPGSEKNMAEFVKHLEMQLYHQASSREEYADLSTLRQRIFSLILRMRNSRKMEQQGPQNTYMTPKPGFPNGSTFSVGNSTSASNAANAIMNVENPATTFAFDSRRSEPLGGYIGNTFPSINRQAAPFSVPGPGFERPGQLSSSPNVPGQLSSNANVPGQIGSNSNGPIGGSWMIPTPGLTVGTTQGFSSSSVQSNGCMNTSNANSGSMSEYLTVENSGLLSSVSHQQESLMDNSHQIMGMDKRLFPDASQFQNSADVKPNLMQIQSQPDPQQLPYGHKEGNGFVSHTSDIGESINFYDPIIPTELGTSNSSSLASSSVNLMTGLPQQQQNKAPQMLPNRDQVFPNTGTHINQEMECKEGSVKDCSLQGNKQDFVKTVQHNADNGGQAYQASSADTGQSEVVSNDDARPSTQIKEVCNLSLSQQVKRQQWLLIFLRHVSRCLDSGKCGISYCTVGRESWNHVISCQTSACSHPRCMPLKRLLKHHKKCRNSECVVCGPVRKYILRHSAASHSRHKENKNVLSTRKARDSLNDTESPPTKKVKVEAQDQDAPKTLQQSVQSMCTFESQEVISCENTLLNPKEENVNLVPQNSNMNSQRSDHEAELVSPKDRSPVESSSSAGLSNQQNPKINHVNEVCKMETKTISEVGCKSVAESMTLPNGESSKSRNLAIVDSRTSCKGVQIEKPIKAKISGISYIESFTPEQIRQHISSLRKWIGQSKGKVEKNQAVERQMLASACSACGIENLYFDPIPIFCTQCGCRIKRNATYYCTGSGDNSVSFCGPCYNAFRSDLVENDGLKVQKSSLVKKKNDEQRVEGWVECDKCKKWQHQICVLFNARINKERSEYICPECCVAEMERSKRIPLSEKSVLGAKDLPTTVLSDFIEERLSSKLKDERAERAKQQGKSVEEIITAEGLVVRVISNIDKKLEVKPKFLDLFQQENYPRDYLYKSKMVMLFQEIEGVEVCLFGMYVQEFGSDNPQPNQRWVYLSYLDSVKYFRPDVKTTKGEALRTYVYHEILIAYLDFCKKRGFSACYIWACPPLKGDDYILYCHPEIQKTPKTDKLREWYLNMISKAKKEDIVVANKNLYDYFFTSNGDCKAVVTAARLPYFDGDYWPGAAEDIILQLQQEEDGLQSHKWGKMKKATTKRTTKTSAQAELLGGTSKDMQLMAKLGQSIVAMKEDFIIVHLHHACSRCCSFIISGSRWYCQQCTNNFQLCSSCYEEHQNLAEEERHPAGKRECHSLVVEEVEGIPDQTFDNDDIMESEFFDNRQAFLSLCQGNQYQYDTLRRAKHSSMMVLYHLHNPSAPAFIASCSVCHGELEGGQGWKCKVCSDFDVCNGCYSGEEVKRHPHSFAPRAATTDLTSASTDVRTQRMLQIRMMLDVLVHASRCREASCQYPKCRNMKDLFRHGNSCTKRAMGGCSICKRMWFLLTAHARSCKETVCTVPRCMDLRRHLRRTQMQQESRRRAAVNEMIRQRAAEAAVSQ